MRVSGSPCGREPWAREPVDEDDGVCLTPIKCSGRGWCPSAACTPSRDGRWQPHHDGSACHPGAPQGGRLTALYLARPTRTRACTHWPSHACSPALHGGQPPPVHASPRPPTAVPLALMGAARPQAHSWMWPLCPGSLSVPGRGPQTATPAAWPASRGKSQRPAPMHTGSPAPPSGPTSRPQAPQDHSPQLLSWGVGRGPAPPPSSACSIRGERASLGRPRREVWVVGWGRGRVPWHPASHHWDQKSRFQAPRGDWLWGACWAEDTGGHALSGSTEGDFARERWRRNVNPCEANSEASSRTP